MLQRRPHLYSADDAADALRYEGHQADGQRDTAVQDVHRHGAQANLHERAAHTKYYCKSKFLSNPDYQNPTNLEQLFGIADVASAHGVALANCSPSKR